ncbi:hypothetical protein ERJ75_001344000 [Trypanosoma vivax]|uniref:Reverse transcriptase domain-containing protein n=1 Tax=Trypanosoma vivax (strain Y486) TaxID=1055687 RepID=G0UD10_TRYVY|nr:hypothetical protein ERJ75_001344000 [Trypanosoma vivax]CCC53720.1 hypothetical protein, conserved in T. vivax [Trypanosoma vivax Y486]
MGENNRDDCEAEAPLRHVSCYLDAVFGEVAAVFDLKASFFQVSLPQESRASFQCRTEAGRFVELTRLPTEYKRCLEILRTVARVLVGGPVIVRSGCAESKSLKIRVLFVNVRISGPR